METKNTEPKIAANKDRKHAQAKSARSSRQIGRQVVAKVTHVAQATANAEEHRGQELADKAGGY